MRTLLLSNDDGIQAPGIHVLHSALSGLADLCVVAPDSERSAIAQAITLTRPLSARPWPAPPARPFGVALSGTPADCVKLALNQVLPEPPALVVSGINLGPNAGISALYSGTVAVATEAAILGLPAVAFSLCTFTDPVWPTAAAVARALVARLLDGSLAIPRGVCWNVNIPNLPLDELRGIRVARMAPSRYLERYTPSPGPDGATLYSMVGELQVLDSAPDTDLAVLDERCVALTPLGLDRTDAGSLDGLAPRMASDFPFPPVPV